MMSSREEDEAELRIRVDCLRKACDRLLNALSLPAVDRLRELKIVYERALLQYISESFASTSG